jgi:hypothetical protein
MSDVAKTQATRTAAHAARSSAFEAARGEIVTDDHGFRREGGTPLSQAEIDRLNDDCEAADIAYARAKRAQSAAIASLSEEQYRALERQTLDEAEDAARAKRDRW